MISNFKKIAIAAARGASAKKAEDVLLLDLKDSQQSLCDYLLILSANSQVHLKTLRDAVEESLEKEGLVPIHQEGTKSGQWTALDYGGVLIHVFHHGARKFYSLERLWPDAKKVRWQGTGKKIKSVKRRMKKTRVNA